jgi:hypothetical protein
MYMQFMSVWLLAIVHVLANVLSEFGHEAALEPADLCLVEAMGTISYNY